MTSEGRVQSAVMDKRVVACNYTEGISSVPTGALAYVLLANAGGGHDRLFVLARSRGGRWIEKWEDVRRLTNFRAKTLPPEHPLHDRTFGYPDAAADDLAARVALLVITPARVQPDTPSGGRSSAR